jgi:PucR family transcriptional regulator, purine catabolism regulatory protein
MPSIIQLVKKVLPAGSTVIHGGTGLYNEVSWVIVIRSTPPGFDSLQGNEFTIIGANTAAGLGVSLGHLIATLAERGAGGIGVMGEITPEAHREAQTKKIPLIQLPPQTNLSTLENAVARLINDERQYLYQREREFNHALMELALAGKNDAAIVQKLQELTGRNLGFIDLNYTPRFPLDPSLAEAFRQQIHQIVPKFRNDSANVSTPVVGLNLAQQQACFLGQIKVGKEIKGYLMLLAPEDQISEVDRMAVRSGTLALAVEMSRLQAVEETEARFESDVIEDLLTRELSAVETDDIARRLDLNLSQPLMILVVRGSNQISEPTFTLKNIGNLLPKALCYYRNGDIVILLPLDSLKTAVELRKLAKKVFDGLSSFLHGKLTLGSGRPYVGINGLRTSFREAEQALSMGCQLFGAGSVTCFGDLGIYRLLFSLKTNGELTDFYKEYLGNLADYDQKHDGELINTLKVYLHYSAVSETAREIHVHRNTLLYRLTRIQEISGVDLEDGETRLSLHLAILAGEILKIS